MLAGPALQYCHSNVHCTESVLASVLYVLYSTAYFRIHSTFVECPHYDVLCVVCTCHYDTDGTTASRTPGREGEARRVKAAHAGYANTTRYTTLGTVYYTVHTSHTVCCTYAHSAQWCTRLSHGYSEPAVRCGAVLALDSRVEKKGDCVCGRISKPVRGRRDGLVRAPLILPHPISSHLILPLPVSPHQPTCCAQLLS